MNVLTRSLKYQLPMLRGRDVLAVQRQLRALGYHDVGQPDGLFGPATSRAVEAFQLKNNLRVDGVVGPVVANALFDLTPQEEIEDAEQGNPLRAQVRRLCKTHRRFEASVQWHLTPQGIAIEDGEPQYSRGPPSTVTRVWNEYGISIRSWGKSIGVPVELLVATICTESSGKADARREEPGWTSDAATPHRVSTGLMQTLISTARETLRLDHIDSAWLLKPDNSIRAGAAYIARQASTTLFDPPVVACAYNAGGVYHNDSSDNRWRMRQYPLGTSHHADRFVLWFNDCFRYFDGLPESQPVPEQSLYRLVRQAS